MRILRRESNNYWENIDFNARWDTDDNKWRIFSVPIITTRFVEILEMVEMIGL